MSRAMRLIVGATSALAITAGTSATAAAAPPIGSCPVGFDAYRVDDGVHEVLAYLDRNENLWFCAKPLENFPLFQPAFQAIDDNVGLGTR